MTKKVKEYKGFHYLLTEIQLYSKIFLETECTPQKVLNKIKEKSIIHNIFRIRDDDSNM